MVGWRSLNGLPGRGAKLTGRGAKDVGKGCRDDVSARFQSVRAIHAAIIRGPIASRDDVAHGISFRIFHTHAAHTRQCHRFAILVEHAAGDDAAFDHFDGD